MKRTLLVVLGILGLFGVVVALGAWEPWASKERERELEWLAAYAAWSDRVDAALENEDDTGAASCDTSYELQVGEPPPRFVGAGRIALDGCRRLRDALGVRDYDLAYRWFDVRDDVLADLTERRTEAAAPASSAELASRAGPLAGTTPEVFCWSSTHWDELNEEWQLIDRDEFWVIGFADPGTDRIHLAPHICEPLDRFFGSRYAPNLNQESLDLAVALVTLAHEAEHLRSPDAPEADVECVAIQRVRDLVRDAGRGTGYENLMTGLAWDVGYPDVPEEYRTERCRDGGPLDLRPATTVFP